jgi:uncharacterized protein (TIGR00725 family)
MGPGDRASGSICEVAYHLGRAIAEQGWTVLTGGRAVGVMQAASQGAKVAGGLVIGILPEGDRAQASPDLDVVIVTGMGQARNVINILSSDVVVACGMGAGTASEVSLALKAQKPVVLLQYDATSEAFFQSLAVAPLVAASTVGEAIGWINGYFQEQNLAL